MSDVVNQANQAYKKAKEAVFAKLAEGTDEYFVFDKLTEAERNLFRANEENLRTFAEKLNDDGILTIEDHHISEFVTENKEKIMDIEGQLDYRVETHPNYPGIKVIIDEHEVIAAQRTNEDGDNIYLGYATPSHGDLGSSIGKEHEAFLKDKLDSHVSPSPTIEIEVQEPGIPISYSPDGSDVTSQFRPGETPAQTKDSNILDI